MDFFMIQVFDGINPQFAGYDLAVSLGDLAIAAAWKTELAILVAQGGLWATKLGLNQICPTYDLILDNKSYYFGPFCLNEIKVSVPENYKNYSKCLRERSVLKIASAALLQNPEEDGLSKTCGLYPNSSLAIDSIHKESVLSSREEDVQFCMKENDMSAPICVLEVHESEVCKLAHSTIRKVTNSVDSLSRKLHLHTVNFFIAPIYNRVFHRGE